MTNEQLAHFRHLLECSRAALNAGIQAAQDDAMDAEENVLDGEGGDVRAQSPLADAELDVATMRTDQWREIDEALLRIQRGEYGRCEACGREIEIERLEAMPTARLCAEDARRADRREVPTL